MYHSRKDFIEAVVKIAETAPPGDDSSVKGAQNDDVPELLQPDEGKGAGFRPEQEAMSTSAEASHKEDRLPYLSDAFGKFQEGRRQTQAELGNLLDHYGSDTISSKPMAEKTSSVRSAAFADELAKISGLRRFQRIQRAAFKQAERSKLTPEMQEAYSRALRKQVSRARRGGALESGV